MKWHDHSCLRPTIPLKRERKKKKKGGNLGLVACLPKRGEEYSDPSQHPQAMAKAEN